MREFRVVVIDAQGVSGVQVLDLPSNDPIPHVQAMVGGTTGRSDFYELTAQFDVWFGVDAEATYAEPNPTAQSLAYAVGLGWQNYHGPIVIVGRDIATGARVGLTEQQATGFVGSVENLMARLARR